MGCGLFAQSVNFVGNAVSAYTLTSDTATNSETLYMTIPFNFNRTYTLTIQPYINNVTGTTAGTALLQAYIGNAWVTLNSGNSELHAANDTLTLVDDATTLWTITTYAYKYRVAFVSTGTHSSKIYASYLFKEMKTERDL